MAQIPFITLARIISEAGFPSGTSQANAIAIVAAESDRKTDARLVNAPIIVDGVEVVTIDRGMWQINSFWHPEVSDAEADDPVLSTAHAFRISKSGTDFSQWATYLPPKRPDGTRPTPPYLAHMEAAKVALDGLKREKDLQKQLVAANAVIAKLKGDVQFAITTLQGAIV